MLLCRVELCVTEMSASRQILMIYIKRRIYTTAKDVGQLRYRLAKDIADLY